MKDMVMGKEIEGEKGESKRHEKSEGGYCPTCGAKMAKGMIKDKMKVK
jgi:hypothetical protein